MLAHFSGPNGYICHICERKYPIKSVKIDNNGYWICEKCLNIKERKEKLKKLNGR